MYLFRKREEFADQDAYLPPIQLDRFRVLVEVDGYLKETVIRAVAIHELGHRESEYFTFQTSDKDEYRDIKWILQDRVVAIQFPGDPDWRIVTGSKTVQWLENRPCPFAFYLSLKPKMGYQKLLK